MYNIKINTTKTFQSDNESNHNLIYKDTTKETKEKVQIFYQPKKFKYSLEEEIDPLKILELESKENNKLIENIDLRFLDNLSIFQSIVLISFEIAKEKNLNLSQIKVYEQLKKVSIIEINNLKILDFESFNQFVSNVQEIYNKYENMIVIFCLFNDEYIIEHFKWITNINYKVMIYNGSSFYVNLKGGMNYIFLPENYIDNNYIKLIFYSDSIFNSKGFKNDVINENIKLGNYQTFKDNSYKLDIDLESNFGIYIQEGKLIFCLSQKKI